MDWRIYIADFLKIKSKWQKRLDSNRYFFVHIPKTGGTTFRYLLYQQFPQKAVFPNKYVIKENKGIYPTFFQLKALPQVRIDQYKLVFGHFIADYVFQLQQEYQLLTFIRNPIDRVISNLKHLQVKTNDYPGKTYEEIYELQSDRIPNMHIRYFALGKWTRTMTREDLEKAKKNLEKCAFIGVMERFEESVELAEDLFKRPLTQVGKLNATHSSKATCSPEFIEHIRVTNELDIEFYNYGVQLFEAKLAELRARKRGN